MAAWPNSPVPEDARATRLISPPSPWTGARSGAWETLRADEVFAAAGASRTSARGEAAPEPATNPDAPRTGQRTPARRVLWEAVIVVALMLALGWVARGALAVLRDPAGWASLARPTQGPESVMKTVANLQDQLARVGVMSSAESVAGVQQVMIVGKVQAGADQTPALAETPTQR